MSEGANTDILDEILTRYDGPILIERLQLLTSRGGAIAGRASLAALRHLDKTSQSSPYVESFVSALENYTPQEGEQADIAKFTNQEWAISLQNTKVRRLRELGADGLYHETDVSKNIEISQIHSYGKQYSEAQSVLSTSTLGSLTCQLAEQSSQVGLLQNHSQLTLNQDKRIEAFLSSSLSNELYLKRLTESEIISYWRVKFYIIYAEFLKQNYSTVATQIYNLIRSPSIQTFTGKEISALDILNRSNFNKFLHRDEIVLISVLSILLSRPSSELLDVLTEEEFISLVGTKLSTFRPFFLAANNAKFKDLFRLLDSLDEIASNNVLISRVWSSLRLTFRQTGYALYLSSVKRVSGEHLSRKLKIPKYQLTREVNEYVKDKKLEFKYDSETDIFEPATINKRNDLINLLQNATEQSDAVENIIRERIDTITGRTGPAQPSSIKHNVGLKLLK